MPRKTTKKVETVTLTPEALEALVAKKVAEATKKADKKAKKVESVVADGFHDLKRISSLTGGKDIKISAIVKDNQITGYFLANMFPNYDGRAKGAHIPAELVEVVFENITKAKVQSLA